MTHCDAQLARLARTQPEMKQATENLQQDIRGPANPHGNVSEKLAAALEAACAGFPEDSCNHVERTVQDHQAVRRPDLRSPAKVETEVLRLCYAYTTILTWHIGSGAADTYGAESASAYHDKAVELVPGSSLQWEIDQLQGSTMRLDAPTWWTFPIGDEDRPRDGRTYLEELALGPEEFGAAKEAGRVVEIEIPKSAFTQDFYKPTAVDAFVANTGFRPSWSDDPFGWTAPKQEKRKPRPEIISKSMRYAELGAMGTRIRLTVLPFEEKA